MQIQCTEDDIDVYSLHLDSLFGRDILEASRNVTWMLPKISQSIYHKLELATKYMSSFANCAFDGSLDTYTRGNNRNSNPETLIRVDISGCYT